MSESSDRADIDEALRAVVLTADISHPLSGVDFATILAQSETYSGLLSTLVDYFRGEPW